MEKVKPKLEMFFYCFILFEIITFMKFFCTGQESKSRLTKDGGGLSVN